MAKRFVFCVHAALALAAIPFTAAADSALDYSYLEVGHTWRTPSDLAGFTINGAIEVGDAWFVFGHYSRESYSRGPAEDFGAGSSEGQAVYDDSERDYTRIGLGYHRRLAPRVDLVARFMYDRSSGDRRYVNSAGYSGAYDFRYDLAQLEAGVRGLATDRLEIWVYGGVTQVLDADFSVRNAAYPADGFIDLRCFVDPDQCFDEDALRDGLEDAVDYGLKPYARVGTLYRLTDTWGVTAAARLTGGGDISYFAGVRASF